MYRKLALPLAALVPFGLAGCPTRDISKVDPSPAIEVRQVIPVNQERNVDILFVIDNSDSMKEEQDSLAQNFINFINVLNSIEGGLPNIHLAVVSSDLGIGGWTSDQCDGVGDDGFLQNAAREAGCTGPDAPERFIRDVAIPGTGMRERNYDGDLAGAFSCIAKLGITGCGVEQHLEAMKLALDGSRLENQGFLRRDAYLAVVILADEDDCSAKSVDQAAIIFNPSASEDHVNSTLGPFNSFRCTEFGILCDNQPLSRAAADYENCTPRPEADTYLSNPLKYFEFLKTLKSNPNLLIGAVIAGNATPVGVGLTTRGAPNLKPSCMSASGNADPAVRLASFVQQFGDRGQFVSICQDDLSDAVQTVAELLARVLGTSCIQADIDTTDIDDAMPGTQLDCAVSDVRFAGQDGEVNRPVPRCTMTGPETPNTSGLNAENPCWWVTVNNERCGEWPTKLEMRIERGGEDAPIGTDAVARCVVRE